MAASTPATLALGRAGIPFTPHAYRHDPAETSYGAEAAEALGVPPGRVLKTLLAEVDDRLVVAVVPVSLRLDLKALAATLGGKRATLAEPAVAERRTGYVRGGISPVGQRFRHTTVVDRRAELFETVFVSGGRRGLDLELSCADLIRATEGTLADIGR